MNRHANAAPVSAAQRQSNRSVGLWLFVSGAFFYLLCTSGHIFTPDGVIMFRVTQSLIERGTVSIQDVALSPGFSGTAVRRRADGTSAAYAKYGLGLSLAALPFYALGRILAPMLGQQQLDLFQIPPTESRREDTYARGAPIAADEDFRWLWYDPGAFGSREGFVAFCVAWTNSFVVAGTLLGIYLICRAIGYSVRVSVATAIVTGAATPLWAYAKDFFSEPLAGLGLTWFVYFALRGHAENRARPWVWSGIALGVVALTKPALIVLTIPASILLAVYLRDFPIRRALTFLTSFALGLGCLVAVIAWYNYTRFGSVLETGYGAEAGEWTTPLMIGLFGLLASPGRGLLLYFPLWLLLLPSARLFSRAHRFEGTFALLCLATLIGLYATWHQWEGGVCWGPRFLVPAIPLLVVPIASLFRLSNSRRDLRIAISFVVVVSAAVAFSGTIVNYFEYANWLKWEVRTNPRLMAQGITSAYQLFVLSPRYAQIVANWTFPRWDFYFVFDAMRRPGAVLVIYAVFAAGFLLGVLRLRDAVNTAVGTMALRPPAAGHGSD